MAQQALRLAGRAPTHVIATHYHGDHTGGLSGANEASSPEVLMTEVTRDTMAERNNGAPREILE